MEHDPLVGALVRLLVLVAILLIFSASQIFWLRRIGELGKRFIPGHRARRMLAAGSATAYFCLLVYNFLVAHLEPSPTHLTLKAALLEAPFLWWAFSSLLGFAVIGAFWLADRAAGALGWVFRRAVKTSRAARLEDPPGVTRRRFLEQTALAASAVPFAACAYGLTFGRADVETSHQRLGLARLPKAFEGFRIAQLSDFHIGPFMTAAEIRKIVSMTNDLKPDLILLTGDYVTWDPSTQGAVVEALATLKAPFGVLGCLGNHELWTRTEDSITRLFAARGIRILRGERATIRAQGESLNIIGVDFQTLRRLGAHGEGLVSAYLRGAELLVMPATTNILLSHNPNTFDRAAELGIDLSLAGHTHGGQVTLEFVSPEISPARLVTPYVRGRFEKQGAQLYVNRGIGTIGVPIRLGSPPEITVFELTRA